MIGHDTMTEPTTVDVAQPVAVYGTDLALTLTCYGRVVTTAVETLQGWHISLGRIRIGPGHRRVNADGEQAAYRPPRCAWWSAPDKQTAVSWLYLIGAHISGGHQ